MSPSPRDSSSSGKIVSAAVETSLGCLAKQKPVELEKCGVGG